jgi:SSS family solute:Na+ symporter
MMGIGFTIGFAQSHFELGAIAGLMLLAYGFLPVYRKLRLYTLSEYLGQRYGESSRALYALIMIVIMVFVQMVPGLYIGSRSMVHLLGTEAGGEIAMTPYVIGVVGLAVLAAVYTIVGGLKAVIWTDVVQSVLLLAAGLTVSWLVFTHPDVGGWSGMIALDNTLALENPGTEKMQLYLPSNHPDLPWSGALSGLLALHVFYWGTNQFIVQRALSAVDDRQARLGIVTAGFFKLLIPFFAIGTGIAAYYLFRANHLAPDSDAAFAEAARLVVPRGFGIVGLIGAGLIGAILSSIDSMMNSSATILTVDIYKRYLRPDASDRELIRVGRLSIVVFVTMAALLAALVLDPNSKKPFFLTIVDYQSHLIPGVLVAFALGMFWRGATGVGATVAIIAGPLISLALDMAYTNTASDWLVGVFGQQLNMLHRVGAAVALTALLHAVVSQFTYHDPEKAKLTWTELGGHRPGALRRVATQIAGSIVLFAAMAGMLISHAAAWFTPTVAAVIASLWTFGLFVRGVWQDAQTARLSGEAARNPLADDRLWAGVLSALAIWMMFYFA